LYYGSEIGMSGDKDKGDDIRQDFPGGWELTKQCFYQRRQNYRTNIL
jgi:glycosidase